MIGIILAGGRATRMGGGDKGLAAVGGVAILDRVIATMRAQCAHLVINANGDAARFRGFGFPVVEDGRPGGLGPLAGVLAGLDWVAAHHPDAGFGVTVPTDTPFLPDDLVRRLVAARGTSALACSRSGGRVHRVAALWSIALRHDLRRALDDGVRKVGHFLERHATAYADWPVEPVDPFFNANTPADLARADRLASLVLAAGTQRREVEEGPPVSS